MAERHRAQRHHEEEAAVRKPHGATAAAGVDVTAKQQSANGTGHRRDRQRAAIDEKILAERDEEPDLPGEVVAGADPAVGEKEEEASPRRLDRARNLALNAYVRRE